jgi:hypothetical protein
MLNFVSKTWCFANSQRSIGRKKRDHLQEYPIFDFQNIKIVVSHTFFSLFFFRRHVSIQSHLRSPPPPSCSCRSLAVPASDYKSTTRFSTPSDAFMEETKDEQAHRNRTLHLRGDIGLCITEGGSLLLHLLQPALHLVDTTHTVHGFRLL